MLRRLTAFVTTVMIAFIVMVKPVHAETNPFNEFSKQVYSIMDETGKVFSLPEFVNYHPEYQDALQEFLDGTARGVGETLGTYIVLAGSCYAVNGLATTVFPPAATLAPFCATIIPSGTAAVPLGRKLIKLIRF